MGKDNRNKGSQYQISHEAMEKALGINGKKSSRPAPPPPEPKAQPSGVAKPKTGPPPPDPGAGDEPAGQGLEKQQLLETIQKLREEKVVLL